MKTKVIVLVMLLGVLVAQALTTEGIWVNDDRRADLRKVVIHGDRVALHTRHGIQRFAAERVGDALVLVRPLRRMEGALLVLRPLGRERLRVTVRRIGRNGLRGSTRQMHFHALRRAGLRPYMGKWSMREAEPVSPVTVRITKRHGRPYIEAWQEWDGLSRLVTRSYARWEGERLVVNWRGRRGLRSRAVIEGYRPDRQGRYRRLRVTLHRPGRRLPVVYHLERVARGWRR